MKKEMQPNYYSGTSGLQLPIPKYLFPNKYINSSRLCYYSSLFNSIEINSSFYKIPKLATIIKWEKDVCENFKFTFKLFKGITHAKGFNFNEKEITDFFYAVNAITNKKGCVLLQFPPLFSIDEIIKLQQLFKCIKETDAQPYWKIAVEFRNNSWYTKTTYNLLKYFNATLVIHDFPNSATPFINLDSDVIYIRFHGPTGDYNGSYSKEILSEFASRISTWLHNGKDVYVYFNNTRGNAIHNLNTLNKFINLLRIT